MSKPRLKTCNHCGGTGMSAKKICKKCSGEGMVFPEETTYKECHEDDLFLEEDDEYDY